ncbi:MAG TPA: hypothetical protein IGS40_07770 [Trichormus sp. M33_DOE_039]|nr:hypothetical protein [Trichormus sp. M33_DOE_039]
MPISLGTEAEYKRGYKPGNVYFACPVSSASSVTSLANMVRYAPFTLKDDVTIDRLSLEIAAAASGALMKIAIFYPSLITKDIPGQRIISTASLDCSTTGIKTGIVADTFLKKGDYWGATWTNSGAIGFRGNNGLPVSMEYLIGTNEQAFTLFWCGYTQSNVTDIPLSVVESDLAQNRIAPFIKFRVKP